MHRSTSDLRADCAELVSDLPPLVSASVAAERLCVSTRTLRTYIRTGRLRAMRTSPGGSGRVLIAREELARLLASMVEPNPFAS